MKGVEFQTLVGQLGALSEGQRAALLKALSGAKKPDEVIRVNAGEKLHHAAGVKLHH